MITCSSCRASRKSSSATRMLNPSRGSEAAAAPRGSPTYQPWRAPGGICAVITSTSPLWSEAPPAEGAEGAFASLGFVERDALDALLGLGGLGHRHGQHTVLERGLDLVLVHLT